MTDPITMQETQTERPYHDVGAMLRNAREHYRLSVENVANALHIRAKYLMALEQGNLKELPGSVYIRGYLRTYAEYLGLDSEEVLRQYANATQLNKPKTYFVPEPTRREHKPGLLLILVCLAGAGIILLGWRLWFSEPEEPAEMVDALPASLTEHMNVLEQFNASGHPCLSEHAPVYPACYETRFPRWYGFYPDRLTSSMELQ